MNYVIKKQQQSRMLGHPIKETPPNDVHDSPVSQVDPKIIICELV